MGGRSQGERLEETTASCEEKELTEKVNSSLNLTEKDTDHVSDALVGTSHLDNNDKIIPPKPLSNALDFNEFTSVLDDIEKNPTKSDLYKRSESNYTQSDLGEESDDSAGSQDS